MARADIAGPPMPIRPGEGSDIVGLRDIPREAHEPFTVCPPRTDAGTMPNLEWSFADRHMRIERGDRACQTTIRELPISEAMASVNMRLRAEVLHPQDARTGPLSFDGGTVRIVDPSMFPASTSIAAVLVEIEPGGLRELHWHPNVDGWQRDMEGRARMGVFASQSTALTFDDLAGDVGTVPCAMGHHIENTGSTPLRPLGMSRSPHDADVSLRQWMALTPHALVQARTRVALPLIDGLSRAKVTVLPK